VRVAHAAELVLLVERVIAGTFQPSTNTCLSACAPGTARVRHCPHPKMMLAGAVDLVPCRPHSK
jgi:hypothetical protein